MESQAGSPRTASPAGLPATVRTRGSARCVVMPLALMALLLAVPVAVAAPPHPIRRRRARPRLPTRPPARRRLRSGRPGPARSSEWNYAGRSHTGCPHPAG